MCKHELRNGKCKGHKVQKGIAHILSITRLFNTKNDSPDTPGKFGVPDQRLALIAYLCTLVPGDTIIEIIMQRIFVYFKQLSPRYPEFATQNKNSTSKNPQFFP